MPVERPLLEIDDLVSLIYSGPMETPPWQRFLSALADRMGARNAALVLRLSRQGIPPLVLWGKPPPLSAPEVRRIHARHAEIGHLDPLRNALDRPGAIFTLDEVVDRVALSSSQFYREVLGPWGLEKQLGMYIAEPGGWEGNIGVINGADDPDFDDDDKAMLRALRPHLEQALAIFARITRNETELQALIDTLDRLTISTLILSGSGKILRANSAAQRMLGAGEVAASSGGRLELVSRAPNKQLQQLIDKALATTAHRDGPAFVEAMRLESPRSQHIGVLVRSLRRASIQTHDSAPAVVVYFAGAGQVQPVERLVTQLFDLTPSEAHLATLLATGSCLGEAAERLRLTENTVRTYCKTILNKVGVRRQTELVRVILRSVAVLG
ncbi:LuxR C-terminal-related transcriptional regulator [Sphingomonas sp. MMSM20]|uniref:helix-turn-helix transcriptional regulator n=1 Tax=Sphingomonas lycopersici TaxID=2951807 RepID=UPI002237CCEB|nr:LuxR C-terminal-related transcriptional regulator [Sphingomonas lycopersici]MCW6532588.1 LuxR C-terminal-related transcriptional regulator [Sphingomonas lycopersici]